MKIRIWYSSYNNITTIVTIHILLIIVKNRIIDTVYQALAFNL